MVGCSHTRVCSHTREVEFGSQHFLTQKSCCDYLKQLIIVEWGILCCVLVKLFYHIFINIKNTQCLLEILNCVHTKVQHKWDVSLLLLKSLNKYKWKSLKWKQCQGNRARHWIIFLNWMIDWFSFSTHKEANIDTWDLSFTTYLDVCLLPYLCNERYFILWR